MASTFGQGWPLATFVLKRLRVTEAREFATCKRAARSDLAANRVAHTRGGRLALSSKQAQKDGGLQASCVLMTEDRRLLAEVSRMDNAVDHPHEAIRST